MLYIVSDIHGEYDKFIEMLKLIQFNPFDEMYILGDVVDRGGESIKLLQYIMNQSNMHMLLGNHEEMMLGWIKHNDYGLFHCWLNNGGQSTYSQFYALPKDQQESIIQYLSKLPLYKIIDSYILVHAGIETEIKNFMFNQDKEFMLWAREEFINQNNTSDYTIIFGHTPTGFMSNNRPMKIWYDNKKVGIDCGACFEGGQLGCLRLDDMKEFYV
jgi:serine/threonine protein phosphatase 1